MLSGKPCQVCHPADCRPDALMFVSSYRHAIAASADQHTATCFSMLYRVGNRMSEIGIVNRIFAGCSIIFYLESFVAQEANDHSFILIPCMVTTNCNGL